VGGCVRMVNCGHPSPYLISPSGATLLNPGHPSPPLGLGSVLPSDYRVDTVLLPPGAMLLLYTDGAIEARDRDGRFYDLTAHLADWRADTQPEELLQHVLDGLDRTRGRQPSGGRRGPRGRAHRPLLHLPRPAAERQSCGPLLPGWGRGRAPPGGLLMRSAIRSSRLARSKIRRTGPN
jgi:hypothetical protein